MAKKEKSMEEQLNEDVKAEAAEMEAQARADEEKKEALVIVNEDNLSLAIGKKGSNIKLASRLTKYKLEIKTMEEINKAGNS